MFSLICNYMKPRNAGWLTKIKVVPNTEQAEKWTTITDPQQMDQELLNYCQMHFSKSFGTPFTTPLLSDLLKYDGMTAFRQQVLQGTADITNLNTNDHTKLLLQHQKYCTPANVPRFQ